MVVRTRARAILIPIAFYLVLGSASGYLVWNASKGQRGLAAKAAYAAEMAALSRELTEVQAEHARWSRRVNAMRSESVDRDLLDQEARALLDRVDKDDVVIITGPPAPSSTGVSRP
jgi:cell division protein FtsB